MSSSTIIYHPGGLGDILMSVPSLRQYRKENPKENITLAVIKRVVDSGIIDECPYIDSLYQVDCAWDDYNQNYAAGSEDVLNKLTDLGKDKVLSLQRFPKKHKILDYADQLGVRLDSTRLEVFIPETIKDSIVDLGKFAFIHSHANIRSKDIPQQYIDYFKLSVRPNPSVQITTIFPNKNINFSFELLRRSYIAFVCESAFLPAADALGHKNLIVYKAPNINTFESVKPLNVKYKEI